MAWENLPAIELDGTVYQLGQLAQTQIDWVTTHSASYKRFNSNPATVQTATYPFLYTKSPSQGAGIEWEYEFDALNKLQFFSQSGWYGYLYFMVKNTQQSDWGATIYSSPRGYNEENYYNLYGILINHDLQLANIWCLNCGKEYSTTYYYLLPSSSGSTASLERFYNSIIGHIPPQYNWSSVQSISGKNGSLLHMSTLNDINDGNEVTTSDKSKFTLVESSNVLRLVNNIINA